MSTLSDLLAAAIQKHQAGRLKAAEQLYRQLLSADPSNALAWQNLGFLFYQTGHLEIAIEYIAHSLTQKPDATAYNNLGLAKQAQGKFEEAIDCYQCALQLNPDLSEAHFNFGNVLKVRRKFSEAAISYRRALQLEPNFLEACSNLGTVLKDQGDMNGAIDCFNRALEIKPDDAEVIYNLGRVRQDQGKPDEAIALYRKALSLDPNIAQAHNNLGVLLRERGQFDEAMDCISQALKAAPNLAETHVNLGNVLEEKGNWEQATVAYERALELDGTYVGALNNLGVVLKNQGNMVRAAASFSRALTLDSNSADAHLNNALLLLLTGDFERGWQEYEWRWKTGQLLNQSFQQLEWSGEPLQGKAILLHAEQGFGDTFQFIRYAPLLKAMGAKVLVQCQRPLVKLLQYCPGIDGLFGEGDELLPHHYHASLMSVPRIFKTTLATIPINVPYLGGDPALIAHWSARLPATAGLRIGISWHGRAGQGSFRRRNIPLEHFVALTKIPGVSLISLQKGEASSDPTRLNLPIATFGDELDATNGSFMDTAAIMMNLDLVITSDTAIAHLVGALGVPVWVALPFAAEWRWLLARTDSPWYPTMRLFRQKQQGDWISVFEEIRSAMQAMLQTRKPL